MIDDLICSRCDEVIAAGELSQIENVPVCVFCAVRMVAGSVGHQRRECACYGRIDSSEQGLTMRQAARAAFDEFRRTHPVG